MKNRNHILGHHKLLKLLPLIFLIILLACSTKNEKKEVSVIQNTPAPFAKKKPYTLELHGITLYDEYHWLKDLENPEVVDHLVRENAFADSILNPSKPLQDILYDELSQRKDFEISKRKEVGNYIYYVKHSNGLQLPVFYRKAAKAQKEELLLDLNIVFPDKKYAHLGFFEPSPDHQYIAFSLDTVGTKKHTLFIKHIDTKQRPEIIPDVGSSASWGNDSQTLLYTTKDEKGRSDKLFLHKLLLSYEDDKLIYSEEDPDFFVKILKSKNNQFLLIEAESSLSSEIHMLSADDPNSPLALFSERVPNLKYNIYPHNDKFFILTNQNKKENQVMVASSGATDVKNWQLFLPNPNSILIEGLETFPNHLALFARKNGIPQVDIKNLITNQEDSIYFDEAFYNISPVPHFDSKMNKLVFEFESLLVPPSIYSYDLDTKEQKVEYASEIKDYNKDDFITKRIFLNSSEQQISVSLVYKKELVLEGSSPLCLFASGAYGENTFSSLNASASFRNRLSLLNRGIIFAVAHISGSGELGNEWGEQDNISIKKRAIDDFLTCGKFLITEGYTSENEMIALSRKAGGVIIGGATLLDPGLFKGVLLEDPYVDIVNFMLNPENSGSFRQTNEWGNTEDENAFNNILTFSPYDNIEAKKFPHMFIMAGFGKDTSEIWQAAKWTARIREYNSGKTRILFKNPFSPNKEEGVKNNKELKAIAMGYAFILDVLNLAEAKSSSMITK